MPYLGSLLVEKGVCRHQWRRVWAVLSFQWWVYADSWGLQSGVGRHHVGHAPRGEGESLGTRAWASTPWGRHHVEAGRHLGSMVWAMIP